MALSRSLKCKEHVIPMFKETTIHPVALGFTMLMCIVVLFIPRRYSLVPFLLVGVFVTEIQRIVILGFDFTMLRLLLFSGFLRIIARLEYRNLEHNSIDTAVVLFVVLDFCAYMLLRGTPEALVNRLGFAYTTLGIYFIIRYSLRDVDDVRAMLNAFIFMAACLAASMVIEQRTGRNLFSIFGGVPDITELRDGKLRSQGAFPHPLLAGAFGASLLPVFYWVYRHEKRWVGAIGIVSSTLIALTSSSSGPIMGFLAGIMGLLSWYLRNYMRAIRWGFLMMLFGLSLVMKAPVYALVGRFTIFEASTGYHRFALIDQAVKRFGEWWLLGTVSTAHWGWGLWDVTNQYIAVGVNGGALVLVVFIATIALAFRNVGAAVRAVPQAPTKYMLWTFGSTLFAHSVTFIGMAYFGAQIEINWYFILVVSALAPRIATSALLSERNYTPARAHATQSIYSL
jgi:hypothetical protein